MATIKISRRWQLMGGLAAYTVLLDGEWAGKLLNEDQIELQTSAGTHSLQLKLDWCRSNIVRFSIAEEDLQTFKCGTVTGPLGVFWTCPVFVERFGVGITVAERLA
jgi:hypothetical protein